MHPLEQQVEIRRLFFAEHWKVGTISSELGVHPDSVKRVIGSEQFNRRKQINIDTVLGEYKPLIIDILEKHPRLCATRIEQMLQERGYKGGIAQLRRYVRTVRPVGNKEAYLKLETLPGEQAQVDWANFGKIRIGNALRPLSCFIMVLSFCRAFFACFTLDQKTESFLLCHVKAFEFFQGCARTLLYDNLKSVVISRVGEHIQYNPRILQLGGHYQFVPRLCAPYRGNEKGKVERVVQYLRTTFFAAREFASVQHLNEQLMRWIEDVANQRTRPGDAQGRTVEQCLQQERQLLLKLPAHRFRCELMQPVCSRKQPYIRFDLNDYSIPYELVGTVLTLIASEDTVRILKGDEQVACHQRSYDKGQVVESEQHLRSLAEYKKKAGELRGRDLLRSRCAHADALIEQLAIRGEHLGWHTAKLVKLLDRYGAQALDKAISQALERSAIGSAAVAHICDQNNRKQGLPPPLPMSVLENPAIRDIRVIPHDLASYDLLVESEQKQERKP